jgi:hypothetical protein
MDYLSEGNYSMEQRVKYQKEKEILTDICQVVIIYS